MAWVTVNQIQDALDAADFPTDKNTLLEQARAKEAPDAVIKALRSLPLEVEYENLDEVIRSVHVDVGTPPSAEQQALRARESRDDQSRVSDRLRSP
jgi:hypothetical protein